jgi:hypothetical protein
LRSYPGVTIKKIFIEQSWFGDELCGSGQETMFDMREEMHNLFNKMMPADAGIRCFLPAMRTKIYPLMQYRN